MSFRDAITGGLYRQLLKPIFFAQDPEQVHDRMLGIGRGLGRFAAGRTLTRFLFDYHHPSLEQTVAGIRFKNPVGLAAGFDKNAELTQILPSVGFGFEEIGSVTGQPCPGNDKPRLWRLPKSKSLAVYYGLKNNGAAEVARRLRNVRFDFVLGVSIAKTNSPQTVEEKAGIEDYVRAFAEFVTAGIGDYYAVNISCPNAFGGEPFSDPGKLDRLLSALRHVPCKQPVFLKMPAELAEPQLDAIIEVARRHAITGFVSTNLAKDRNNPLINPFDPLPEKGGLSGKVVAELSNRQIAYLYRRTRGEFVIMGCGGVFTAEDAYKKIRSGASLIQLITGMIYRGPQAIAEINRGLAQLLRKDGYNNVSEAVGADIRS